MKFDTFQAVAHRSLLALACAAAFAAPMMAQDPSTPPPPQQQGPGGYGHHGEMEERQVEHLTRALNLSADQVSQVKAIQAESQQQMMAVRQDESVQGPDRRAKMMSIRQAQETKIRSILTDDQKTKFDAMQAKAKERQEERREQQQGNGQTPPPPPAA